MKRIIIFVILLSIYNLSSGQNLPGNSELSEISITDNTINKNLVLDQVFVDYINSQLKADGFDQVIIWADSILASENLTFEQADLIFICNYFSTEGGQISIMPTSRDTTKRGLPGHNGRSVNIIAKRIKNIKLHLPGGDGLRGKKGKKGKNGVKKAAKPTPNGASRGTPGGDGQRGGDGGDGGNLAVSTFGDYKPDITLIASPGNYGKGGAPGTGGFSYVPKISKIINPHKAKEQIIYSIAKRKEKDGKKGKRGDRGARGKMSRKIIDEELFNEQLWKLFSVEPDILKKAGWEIILSSSKSNNLKLESLFNNNEFQLNYQYKNLN